MILPISWVRVFRFKPRKLSIVIDLVVANKRFGLGSVWLQNSCQFPYTSLPSEPSLQEKTLPILFFSSRMREPSDVVWTGSEKWTGKMVGACLRSPRLRFKSFCILASHVLERITPLYWARSAMLLGSVAMYACQPICQSGYGPSHTWLHCRVLVCPMCSCGALVTLKSKRDHLFVFIFNAPQKAAANIALLSGIELCLPPAS